MATYSTERLRRGLPRIPGGPAWPDVEGAVLATPATVVSPVSEPALLAVPTSDLRRGLPRTPGGEPWPPVGIVVVTRAVASPPPLAKAPAVTIPALPEPQPAAAPTVETTPPPSPVEAPATPESATPSAQEEPTPEPLLIGSRTLAQWARLVVLWCLGAIGAAGVIVLAARGVTTLPGVPEFVERYPGEYAPAVIADPGFPAWARWAHFLNFFFIALIVRSGLLVRTQQRPDAYFTPKKGGKKVSIYLWLHTSIDILWLVNGLIFGVLLFVSGHWARIVPTSWEVVPNALSVMLQYLTLDWPSEDGWVNYNALQQLMYFTVVFIAAPLAAITGVRMSKWWPEDAPRLNKAYPAFLARAIHFPVMLFFVLFVIVHVFLVFATGALKNLNHMFAGTPEVTWTGFWLFAGAVFLVSAVTWAARPLVLAPIAGRFGQVSER